MIDKLQAIEDRYLDLEARISDPDVIANQDEWLKCTKAHAKLTDIVTAFREYRDMVRAKEDAEEIIFAGEDEELVEMAKEELKELKPQIAAYEERLTILLLPSDPNDDKNVIVEIRGGAGGEEAALFAGVLFRMYLRYAETRGWRVEILDSNPTELGGFKEVVFQVNGDSVFSRMKFESGVHRVQRVPETESQGRVHTSTVTVAVLPEAEEVDVEINPADLRIDTYRAGVQAVRTLIRLNPQCALPTCPLVLWHNARTKNLKSRTAKNVCAYCVPAFWKWNRKNNVRQLLKTVRARLAPVTAVSVSVLIIILKAA